MDKESKILVTGSSGMVGKALIKKLNELNFRNLLLPNSNHLDLRDQRAVETYFTQGKPEYVFHLAAVVGGIAANIACPAKFLYDNLMIQTNVSEAARKEKVKKLLFMGSSCIYPRECSQPMKEEYLLSGKLEPTNEAYALAKICGLKLCEYYNKQYGTNFISIMPPNLYGPNDHFNSEKSHVISALISKFDRAKTDESKFVEVWGTGTAQREFLFVEDVADAMIYLMQNYSSSEIGAFINVGYGKDITIRELAELIKEIVDYRGKIIFDKTKPDGMPKKLLDISKAEKMGWKAKTSLKEGLEKTYAWYKENLAPEK